jgi:hypothetical protein
VERKVLDGKKSAGSKATNVLTDKGMENQTWAEA